MRIKFQVSFILLLITLGQSLYGAESYFKVGRKYTVPTGYGGSAGSLRIAFDGTYYRITLPLGFYGAIHFAHATRSNTRMLNDIVSPYPETFFVGRNGSFQDNPVITEAILQVCKQIELIFNHKSSKIRLSIEPIFLEQGLQQDLGFSAIEKIPYFELDYHVSRMLLKKRNPAIGIFIDPFPSQTFIHPRVWDLFADPSLLAHEVGHLLGINDEGYELSGYPLDGLMTDETRLRYFRIKHPNATSRLYPEDENSILAAIAERATSIGLEIPPMTLPEARRTFSPRISQSYPTAIDLPGGWHPTTLEEKVRYLNKHYAKKLGLPPKARPQSKNCREILGNL